MRYGMPYRGSKNRIAKEIIEFLPKGKRLVDLFGGGGAIFHCAVMSNKWDKVLYNEYDKFVYDGFNKAIKGGYKNEKRWISHEQFMNLRNKDFYVACCFSFGNNLRNYCYSPIIEPWKKALHYARVLNDFSLLQEFGIYTDDASRTNIKNNHEEYKLKYADWCRKKLGVEFSQKRLQRLDFLHNLQCLERLWELEGLESLQTSNISYVDYKYKKGDVVYCDPPYENTGQYREKFNSKEFYNWAISREYPVYFSSYDAISDDRFKCVWSKEHIVLFRAKSNRDKKTECIWWNGR